MIYAGKSGMIDAVQKDVDYVDSNGNIQTHSKAKEIVIRTENDLDLLTGYDVGTIAYVPGMTKQFMLSAYGNWVGYGSEEDIPSESESESDSTSSSESESESDSTSASET